VEEDARDLISSSSSSLATKSIKRRKQLASENSQADLKETYINSSQVLKCRRNASESAVILPSFPNTYWAVLATVILCHYALSPENFPEKRITSVEMKVFWNLLCIGVVYSSVISLIVETSPREGRSRRENRGRKASLVRKLMRNSRRIREGSIRLVEGSNEHEGIQKRFTHQRTQSY